MAEPHPKGFAERLGDGVTAVGIEGTRKLDNLTHRLKHAAGLDHHAAPANGPGVPERVERIFRHDDLKPYETPLGNSQADRHLKAAMQKRDEGIAIANHTFDKHVGKSLHVLADPEANVVECAKAFKDLAHEVQIAASPGSLIKEIGIEVLDHKLPTALAKAEKKYPHEFKTAESVATGAKAFHEGHKLGEKIEKDVEGIRKDLKDLHKAVGNHDYAGMAVASKHLVDHTTALHHDVKTAEAFVQHEAKLAARHVAKTGHGQDGMLHTRGSANPLLAGPTTIGGQGDVAAPGANVTPADHPLAHLKRGERASIERHQDGNVSIRTQPQAQNHDRQHAQHHPALSR